MNEQPGCLGFLFNLFGAKPAEQETEKTYRYRAANSLLSPAEISFYHALQAAVAGRASVNCKVRLADILKSDQSGKGAFYKVSQKHVDFLLCDPQTMRPLAVVELDDRSHGRRDRQERDTFVDAALAGAGLPIVRVNV